MKTLKNLKEKAFTTKIIVETSDAKPFGKPIEGTQATRRDAEFRKIEVVPLSEIKGFEKEFYDIYLLLRDAYNQLERGKEMDMVKLGSSIRVAFRKIKQILGVDEEEKEEL